MIGWASLLPGMVTALPLPPTPLAASARGDSIPASGSHAMAKTNPKTGASRVGQRGGTRSRWSEKAVIASVLRLYMGRVGLKFIASFNFLSRGLSVLALGEGNLK